MNTILYMSLFCITLLTIYTSSVIPLRINTLLTYPSSGKASIWLGTRDRSGSLSVSGRKTTLIEQTEDSSTFQWSANITRYRTARHEVVLHNVTTFIDTDGYERTRWLKRQYVPRQEELLGVHYMLGPEKRGFWLSPPSVWPGRTRTCPAVITLCFENQLTVNYLDNEVNLAIERWHSALGTDRGVELSIIPGKICELGRPGYSYDTVQITFRSNGQSGATVGYKPILRDKDGKVLGRNKFNRVWPYRRHSMYLIPQGKAPLSGLRSQVGTKTHEFGHILGLEHEHQRPDAAQHVDFICQNMVGYNSVILELSFINPLKKEDGSYATIEDACTDISIAAQVGSRGLGFNPSAFLPVPESDHQKWRGGLLQSLSPFDYESIMLYPGRQGIVGPDGVRKDVLVRVDDKRPLEPNEFPSLGDVAAVKAMYPDIIRTWTE